MIGSSSAATSRAQPPQHVFPGWADSAVPLSSTSTDTHKVPTAASGAASASGAPTSSGPGSHTRSVALPIAALHLSILERGPLIPSTVSASASASASLEVSTANLPSPALHQHVDQYHHHPSSSSTAASTDSTANAEHRNAAAREHSLRQWLASLIADDAAARHAPLLCETVDAHTGLRQLEVNSATLAAVELSLEHALAQRVGAFADRARAAFERRVRAVAADAARTLRDAATQHAQRVALVEREAGALVAAAERRARRAKAQIIAAEERAAAAELECAQRRAAELEWHMQRAEWREARRDDRARVQRVTETAQKAIEAAEERARQWRELVDAQQAALESANAEMTRMAAAAAATAVKQSNDGGAGDTGRTGLDHSHATTAAAAAPDSDSSSKQPDKMLRIDVGARNNTTLANLSSAPLMARSATAMTEWGSEVDPSSPAFNGASPQRSESNLHRLLTADALRLQPSESTASIAQSLTMSESSPPSYLHHSQILQHSQLEPSSVHSTEPTHRVGASFTNDPRLTAHRSVAAQLAARASALRTSATDETPAEFQSKIADPKSQMASTHQTTKQQASRKKASSQLPAFLRAAPGITALGLSANTSRATAALRGLNGERMRVESESDDDESDSSDGEEEDDEFDDEEEDNDDTDGDDQETRHADSADDRAQRKRRRRRRRNRLLVRLVLRADATAIRMSKKPKTHAPNSTHTVVSPPPKHVSVQSVQTLEAARKSRERAQAIAAAASSLAKRCVFGIGGGFFCLNYCTQVFVPVSFSVA